MWHGELDVVLGPTTSVPTIELVGSFAIGTIAGTGGHRIDAIAATGSTPSSSDGRPLSVGTGWHVGSLNVSGPPNEFMLNYGVWMSDRLGMSRELRNRLLAAYPL